MKSKMEQMESRGYVAAGVENKYDGLALRQRIDFLQNKLATERTIGARLLANNSDLSVIDFLIDALTVETKLYPKIEICNSLVSFGADAVIPLIEVLGRIGNNQYRKVPTTDFKKYNYPLPHDIAARTLIRIGPKAIPDLLKVLDSNDLIKISEAIDTIGYICFYEHQSDVFELVHKCFNRIGDNDLIKWKVFRAMSAFPESESFLTEQLKMKNENLRSELVRSLSLIKQSLTKINKINQRHVFLNNSL